MLSGEVAAANLREKNRTQKDVSYLFGLPGQRHTCDYECYKAKEYPSCKRESQGERMHRSEREEEHPQEQDQPNNAQLTGYSEKHIVGDASVNRSSSAECEAIVSERWMAK